MSLAGHSLGRAKRVVAGLVSGLAVGRALLGAQRALFRPGYVRAVNYHDTPPCTARAFEKQLQWYQRHFSPTSAEDLRRFFRDGRWHRDKPGLLLSFDDGLRSNYDVARPLLEQYGFTGWFFVPTGFVDAPPHEQPAFAAAHRIRYTPPAGAERIAMTWDEARALARHHVVGCHTRTHHRMTGAESDDALHAEIVAPKHELERVLQREVEAFCWVGGEETSYSSRAARAVHDAGYRFGFMTCSAPIHAGTDRLQLQRTNVESSWPVSVVQFQLSGLMDVRYTPKRRRVSRVTCVAGAPPERVRVGR